MKVGYCTVFPALASARQVLIFTMERVSVYIDGANFFGGLITLNEKYTDTKFDFENYILDALGKRELIKIYYYNASLKQQINPEIFQKQQKLFERLRKIEKFNVVLCKRQKRQNPDGEHYYTIKGDDIHLAIDMLRDAYENEFDTAVLISGDGDFAPLVRYIKNKNKRVEGHYFEGNISLDLLNECNQNVIINKKTANKYFYREDE